VPIAVKDLTFAYPGGDPLFFEVSFFVGASEHVAMVGANGVGKSTIVRLIARQEDSFDGEIHLEGSAGYLAQDAGVTSSLTVEQLLARCYSRFLPTRLEACLSAEPGSPEHDLGAALGAWGEAGGWEAEGKWDAITRRVLGQSIEESRKRLVMELSGGERKRVALECLLRSDFDTLLLDEPDNSLDLAGKIWLADEIRKSKKTILLISHDRAFLSHAIGQIITIEGHGAWIHHGSYANYEDARYDRNLRLASQLDDWRAEERRLYRYMKWMKHRAMLNSKTASAADAAETRWKKFVAAGPPPPPVRIPAAGIRLGGASSGRKVLSCSYVSVEGLIAPFDLEVRFGDRVVLLGPNGAGKSHLQRLFAGEDLTHGGQITFGARVHPSYFHQLDDPEDFVERTPLAILSDHLPPEKAFATLGRYGLADTAKRPYETMSGGQKARLQIALLEIESQSLLILDEPVDNLDIQSAEALETALDEYEGTVICVTHDRWFMRRFSRFLVLDRAGRLWEYNDLDTAVGAVLGDREPSVHEARNLVSSRRQASTRAG
jgi:ATPase subunit of ABC transporter with duplicated ATPase domains